MFPAEFCVASIFDARILQLTDRLNLLRDSLASPLLTAADKLRIESQIKVTARALQHAREREHAELGEVIGEPSD
jgi:hypothetical protein